MSDCALAVAETYVPLRCIKRVRAKGCVPVCAAAAAGLLQMQEYVGKALFRMCTDVGAHFFTGWCSQGPVSLLYVIRQARRCQRRTPQPTTAQAAQSVKFSQMVRRREDHTLGLSGAIFKMCSSVCPAPSPPAFSCEGSQPHKLPPPFMSQHESLSGLPTPYSPHICAFFTPHPSLPLATLSECIVAASYHQSFLSLRDFYLCVHALS